MNQKEERERAKALADKYITRTGEPTSNVIQFVSDTGCGDDDTALEPAPAPARVVPLAPVACPLDSIETFLGRFIAYPSEHERVAHVLWCAHTHLIECFETTPRLAFMSAEKASGKTRALEVTALFVMSPISSFSVSAAALVRLIERGYKDGVIPTILFDEIDNVFRGSGDKDDGTGALRGALNAGYRRGATSQRCVNHGSGLTDFRCFAPLAVAGLRSLPDTLASRSIFIRMRRRAPDEKVESYRLRYHPTESEPLAANLFAWCKQNEAAIAKFEPEIPDGIADRDADCWEPLFTIADFAGGDWPARVRAAARYLTDAASDDTLTPGVELLAHIREAFVSDDKMWTEVLIQHLVGRDESPWADIRGKPITDRQLSDRLRQYRVKPRDVKIGGTNRKGYYRADFEDLWKRYLPPTAAHAATAATAATFLMNKDNLVAPVAPVAPGTAKALCSACDGKGCPTCQPKRFGIGVE